jgi:hypothetical protein
MMIIMRLTSLLNRCVTVQKVLKKNRSLDACTTYIIPAGAHELVALTPGFDTDENQDILAFADGGPHGDMKYSLFEVGMSSTYFFRTSEFTFDACLRPTTTPNGLNLVSDDCVRCSLPGYSHFLSAYLLPASAQMRVVELAFKHTDSHSDTSGSSGEDA